MLMLNRVGSTPLVSAHAIGLGIVDEAFRHQINVLCYFNC